MPKVCNIQIIYVHILATQAFTIIWGDNELHNIVPPCCILFIQQIKTLCVFAVCVFKL